MRSESLVFAIAGVMCGLIAGWVIGSRQVGTRPSSSATSTAASPSSDDTRTRPALLDQAQVDALRSVASREPSNAQPRIRLGNLYFDAERYDEAVKWYGEAVKLAPNDVNVSTDLGVSYFYTNQLDKALEQLDRSLTIDPNHTKTLLNLGIVKAFGKQDLDGAAQAWQKVIELAPDSPEGQAAKRALNSLQSAHPGLPGAADRTPGD